MLTRIVLIAAVLLAAPLSTRAHCDTLDGPVVKTARTALDARNAIATCSVAGNFESTLHAPMSASSAMTSRRRNPNVVRRRAATDGSRTESRAS